MPCPTSLSAFLTAHPRSVLVEITQAKGSTPRGTGAFMLVAEKAICGTIGGGQFEYMAIDNARALLQGGGETVMDIPLGPKIGQCCGGHTRLAFTAMTPMLGESLMRRVKKQQAQYPGVFVFGAGHVGKALALALSPLPLAVTVIESRAEALEDLPENVATHLTPMPESMVANIPAGGAAIVLTHDHGLDFLIAAQALARTDLAYIGMIGSLTKRATFERWLMRQGGSKAALSRLTLPIGGNMVTDKRPAVIAAMTAAELLQVCARRQENPSKRHVPQA